MAKGSRVEIKKVPLNKIKLNKNSRLNIDPEELSGLMSSIKEEGLLQPIGLIKSGDGYEICYGNRRFLAISKLGMNSIPAIVHEKKKESDVDIKNLTENIQRRQISLAEIGRYVDLLKKQGLSAQEVSVRLGVSIAYIKACISSFQEVPKEFMNDIDIRVVNGKNLSDKRRPGKIAIKTARAIISAGKAGLVDAAGQKALFKAAKTNPSFEADRIREYAKAVRDGKDPLAVVEKQHRINLSFYISDNLKNALQEKYVENGPFKTINELLYAVLRGEKSVKLKFRRYGEKSL